MTTGDPNNVPARGGNGRFRRTPAAAERDARAADLASQGWSYGQIARELGYHDRAGAWRAVQGVLSSTLATPGNQEAHRRQVRELALLRARMWRVVESPPPAFDRLGRVVRDDETGDPVPDVASQTAAAQVVLRAAEREAKLRGLDAPRRSVSVSAVLDSLAPEDLREHIDRLRAQTGAAEAEAAQVEEPGRPAIPGRVEPEGG